VVAGGLIAEIVIEGEDAVNLGARQVQRRCDHGSGGFRHVTERFLHRMQDHQRRAFELVMLRDDLGAARLIPGFVDRCHPRSQSRGYYSLEETWNCSKYQ
jgi:hypothetical protein